MRVWAARAVILGASLLAAHCSSTVEEDATEAEGALEGESKRDFSKYPVIEKVTSYTDLYAMSDLHGRYDRMVDLLKEAGLIEKADEDTPPSELKWIGGKAILVVCGDAIDKGPNSVEVLEGLMTLEAKANRAGGQLIFTLGNHEAEFLADPHNAKASRDKKDEVGINVQLGKMSPKVKPEQFASWDDPHGKWLRTRPIAAVVGDWFFSHGGSTSGMSMRQLTTELQEGLKKQGYKSAALIGEDSILEAQEWYGKKGEYKVAKKNAEELGVKHIVFGHDPGAFEQRGVIREREGGLLFAIDTGLGMAETKGFVLHIKKSGSKIEAHAISHVHGEAPEKLWDN